MTGNVFFKSSINFLFDQLLSAYCIGLFVKIIFKIEQENG